MARKNQTPVSVFALGGLGEVGKNTYCIESETSIIIIDAGVKFPEADLPGVDYVIPDYTYLKANRSKIKALIITHGHEDHIGGIPFLIRTVSIPVIYAPRLAAALIRTKLDSMRIKDPIKIIEYDANSNLNIGDFQVKFFRVTHSIPDAYGICVDTTEGRIIDTGDFKIDLTPVGPDIEIDKIARYGDEGVDLLLSDSTNAEIEGYTPSEKNVIESINEIFSKAEGRIIVSTFSSNISRIQQVVQSAVEHKRKVCIVGRSMENVVSTARGFGYIKIPDTSVINPEDINKYHQKDVCILCTGSQGEPMAALSRIARGEHKQIRVIPGDTVIFSSSPIPGNGLMIEKLVNVLVREGALVLTNGVLFALHSSGHPAKQELRIMLKLLHPNYFMPAHGEYRMLRLHGELAQTLGIPKDHIFVCANGDKVELLNHKCSRGDRIQADAVYIDGNDINGLSTAVIKDRNILREDGMVTVLVAIDSKTNQLLLEPKIYTAGFLFPGNGNVVPRTEKIVGDALKNILKGRVNFNDIKNTIRNVTGKALFTQTERNPMIIPVIMNKN
jgi:ribonuclease J